MFKVFITNLGKYTEGKLVGKWLDLPCNNITEELKSIDIRPNSKYEEAFITDYENDWMNKDILFQRMKQKELYCFYLILPYGYKLSNLKT